MLQRNTKLSVQIFLAGTSLNRLASGNHCVHFLNGWSNRNIQMSVHVGMTNSLKAHRHGNQVARFYQHWMAEESRRQLSRRCCSSCTAKHWCVSLSSLVQILLSLEKELNGDLLSRIDWMAGTSSGGIIALMLCHGKYFSTSTKNQVQSVLCSSSSLIQNRSHNAGFVTQSPTCIQPSPSGDRIRQDNKLN